MKAIKSVTMGVTVIALSMYLSIGQAQQFVPLEPLTDPVSTELTDLLACFTCARVRTKTEGDCMDDSRQDGEVTWGEQLNCYLGGLMAEQSCLDALVCN